MKVNYCSLYPDTPALELQEHSEWLASWGGTEPGAIGTHPPPEGYEAFTSVDVLGSEFVWMNDTFPGERFTWYVWFESVFLVPAEMVPFLQLRWG